MRFWPSKIKSHFSIPLLVFRLPNSPTKMVIQYGLGQKYHIRARIVISNITKLNILGNHRLSRVFTHPIFHLSTHSHIISFTANYYYSVVVPTVKHKFISIKMLPMSHCTLITPFITFTTTPLRNHMYAILEGVGILAAKSRFLIL